MSVYNFIVLLMSMTFPYIGMFIAVNKNIDNDELRFPVWMGRCLLWIFLFCIPSLILALIPVFY